MEAKNRPVSRSFAEALPSLKSLAQKPESPKARTEKIKNNWQDIMKDEFPITMQCHEVIIRRKQYILQVSAPAIHPLMMRHHSPAIVKKINDFFGETMIDGVLHKNLNRPKRAPKRLKTTGGTSCKTN